MSTNLHRTWNRPVALLTAAMMFTGGCGVPSAKPYTTPTSPYPTPTSSAGTMSSSPPPGPVKYAFATFKSCPEIRQKVPDLPPPLKPERAEGPDRFSQTCTFTTSKDDGPFITFRVELYGNQQDVYGFHSGAELAKTGFNVNVPSGTEKESSLGIGSEARWADPGVGDSCKLEVLDENAAMITSYNSGKEDNDPRSEQCRDGARDVAKQIYVAVQPQ
ncbi:hypothetical protein [Saccharopolyspora phatthalungensis]|uniref:DUF3558 domain-containing protein n=1 Tax=Saccharopolyspora phatthalungensis TaxID=664693 RepID=A0A840QKE8_9PSEU|nr:hypothetical protein [Saccharopolyspora phatthalungensis]MBB5158843.1 hypothetical protein [Saccharopolyspora phatthalungensis]